MTTFRIVSRQQQQRNKKAVTQERNGFSLTRLGSANQHSYIDRMIPMDATTSKRHSTSRFPSPAAWLEHYEHCVADGVRGWEPQTRDELLLAESSGHLANHPEWVPCKIGLRLLGLPDWFGRKQKPFSPRWAERFLRTFVDDRDLQIAFRRILNDEVSS